MSGQPRKASVYAVGKAVCFYITRPTFKRILGPLQSILETDMDKYAKYQDAMKDAVGDEEEDKEPEDEDTHLGAKQEKKPKVVRKREKKQEDATSKLRQSKTHS